MLLKPRRIQLSLTPVGASLRLHDGSRDLGSTAKVYGTVAAPGTYFVTHITFSLSASFALEELTYCNQL